MSVASRGVPAVGRTAAIVLVGWALFLIYQAVYCSAFQSYVLGSDGGLAAASAWAVREWGPWLLLSPLCIWWGEVLSRKAGPIVGWATVTLAALLLILAYRVGLDAWQNGADLLGSLVYFSPRHLAALLVMGLALPLLRAAAAPGDGAGVADAVADVGADAGDRTLLVNKGCREVLLRMGEIESASAAGNYVELCSRGQTYLLRATLGGLLRDLPSRSFLRIHRSHIVNLEAIDHFQVKPSGNGIVLLKDGRSLALSKHRARALRRHRPAPA